MGDFRIASFFALAIGGPLVLGIAPPDAFAGVCKALDQEAGCVVPNDMKKNAVKAKQRLDEAGTNFVSEPDTQQEIQFVPKVYTSVVIQPPARGTVIVNASITVQGLKNPGPGTGPGVQHGEGSVECALTGGGNVIALNNPNRFFGSVNWDEGIEYETIAITRGFNVAPAPATTIALSCRVIPANGIGHTLVRVRAPSISAAYFANLN